MTQRAVKTQNGANGSGTQEVALSFASAQGFEMMQRAARLLAASTLVPVEYQGNIPNCVIALNMANRMQADPLMVMQNLYIVHGRPGWSSQFLISTFNTSGRFSALRYEWTGEKDKDSWGCRAWAVEKATGEKIVGSEVTIGLAKAEGWFSRKGSKWQTMPQQMLMYRAAAWFIRAYAPEIAMGMHTADELGDIVDLDEDQFEVHDVGANANKDVIDVDGPEAEAPAKAEQSVSEEGDDSRQTDADEYAEEPWDAGAKAEQASLGGPGF